MSTETDAEGGEERGAAVAAARCTAAAATAQGRDTLVRSEVGRLVEQLLSSEHAALARFVDRHALPLSTPWPQVP